MYGNRKEQENVELDLALKQIKHKLNIFQLILLLSLFKFSY